MADIIDHMEDTPRNEGGERGVANGFSSRRMCHVSSRQLVEMMELLFFAYRDFTNDPDALLARYGFGRAHHRVLHFVNRYPGLRVADLLDILRITKQSLARVLKQLIEQGFIEQRPGERDRRERRLFVSPRGRELALMLMEPQLARLDRALGRLEPEKRSACRDFLCGMINASGHETVRELFAFAGTENCRKDGVSGKG